MLHKYKMLPLVAVMLVMSLVFSAQAAPVVPDFVPLVQSAGKAVVNISTEKKVMQRGGMPSEMFRGLPPEFERFFEQFEGNSRNAKPRTQRSLGTGFLISSDGYIVTNNHVVAGADTVLVNLQGSTGKEHSLKAQVIGTDEETDIALLKVKADAPLPFLNFGNSDKMEVGEWVLAIGNPFGLGHTVTAGILSAKGRNIQSGPFDNFLQTDASINPGNSGGPLLNILGELIGINTAIDARGEGIGFAIPIHKARRVVEEILGKGHVTPSWLALIGQDVDPHTARVLRLPSPEGLLITEVLDGPAAKAGLKPGDVVRGLDGHPVSDRDVYLSLLRNHQPGDDLALEYYRDGKAATVTLSPAVFDDKTAENLAQRRWGTTVKDGRNGAVVDSVRPGSPAEGLGLAKGDLIAGVGGRAVKGKTDYLDAFRRAYLNQQILLRVVRGNRVYQVRMGL